MSHHVDIQSACSEPAPDEEDLRRWIAAALSGRERGETEISLRLVGEAEMRRLNRDYRGVDGPTNVLSFAADFPGDIPHAHAHVVPMVEKTDITSRAYVDDETVTFRPAPRRRRGAFRDGRKAESGSCAARAVSRNALFCG